MATPITWKNVPGSSSSSVDEAVQPYGILNSGLTSGFAQLSKVLDQYKKGEMGAAEDALMAQLGQYATPEQMAQAQASGAITGAIDNRWVDAAEATRAIDARLSGLQTQARSAQEYSDYTDAVASRPHMEAISNMGARGDIAGIEAYIAENSDVRGLGAHAQRVLDSIYNTQSAQANIATMNAKLDLTNMDIAERQRLEQNRLQAEDLYRHVNNESSRLGANRGLLEKTSQEIKDIYGDLTVLDEDGLVDLPATQANAEQAVKDNALAYSLANVDQNNWNRMSHELNLSEQERMEREKQMRQSLSEWSPRERQEYMMTGHHPSYDSPRTMGEWQGTIPELMTLPTLDDNLAKRYSHFYDLAGSGTDTAALQALRTQQLDAGVSPSVIEDVLSKLDLTSAPASPSGLDDTNRRIREATTKSAEDEVLKGDQTKILEGFINSASENGYIKEEPESITKVAREALKLANKERTIIGPDGKAVTYFLPEEVLNVVLKTMRTRTWTFGRDNEFRKALEDWEKVNMDNIIGGAYDREEILKKRNHANNLKALGVSSSEN